MNFKIIELGHGYPDVLIYRDRNDYNEIIVNVYAIGVIDGEDDMIALEVSAMPNVETAQDFIMNYNQMNAEKFCLRNSITYSK